MRQLSNWNFYTNFGDTLIVRSTHRHFCHHIVQVIQDLRVLHQLLQANSAPLVCQALLWVLKGIWLLLKAALHGIIVCVCGILPLTWAQRRAVGIDSMGCGMAGPLPDVEAPTTSEHGLPKVVVFIDDLDR